MSAQKLARIYISIEENLDWQHLGRGGAVYGGCSKYRTVLDISPTKPAGQANKMPVTDRRIETGLPASPEYS
ncbi:hypothetical protein HN588_01480 [Candidatus Bathyarchaeota archaeon]|jgi:hypothetical protein|nr:hypothetical protein [Candidatus Bathyarchaeota archaeon]